MSHMEVVPNYLLKQYKREREVLGWRKGKRGRKGRGGKGQRGEEGSRREHCYRNVQYPGFKCSL